MACGTQLLHVARTLRNCWWPCLYWRDLGKLESFGPSEGDDWNFRRIPFQHAGVKLPDFNRESWIVELPMANVYNFTSMVQLIGTVPRTGR